jgi:hypothetical protein
MRYHHLFFNIHIVVGDIMLSAQDSEEFKAESVKKDELHYFTDVTFLVSSYVSSIIIEQRRWFKNTGGRYTVSSAPSSL